MKHIKDIFLRDLHRIRINVVALVVAIGICIIPALYAWFNLAANWDPYSNTNGIKVAVVNNDQPSDKSGISMDVGSQIIGNLKENKAIGWTFVGYAQAIKGVHDGSYYAAIVIPEDFTKDMLSFLSDNVTHPELEYYVNEKKNAVAPKITDKGMTTIQEQVNSTFIRTAVESIMKYLDVTAQELGTDGSGLIDRMVTRLRTIDKNLAEYETSVDSFIATTKQSKHMLHTAKLLVPDVTSTISVGQKTLSSAKKTLKNAQSDVTNLSTTLGTSLDAMQTVLDEIGIGVDTALTGLENGGSTVASDLDWTSGKLSATIELNNQVIDALTDINKSLPTPSQEIEDLIEQLKELSKKEAEIKDLVDEDSTALRSSITTAKEEREDIKELLSSCRTDLSDARSHYTKTIVPRLNSLLHTISLTLGDTSGLLTSVKGSMKNMTGIFDGLNTSMNYGVESLTNTKTLIGGTRSKIHEITGQLTDAADNEKLQTLFKIMKEDPDIYGSFLSAPVKLKTTNLYKIKNYGSAMTPFYTILAIWVGGIVLVAIMKVNVDEDENIQRIKPNEAYFGRYLIFFVMGQIQSLIICLGDLFFLRVQCENPILFILAGSIASFIFTSFIYTLTVSFGAIGKALSVIFLVLQIAGAGGTYPVEVLPEFFQNINPFFPFTYGINAMRETIGGVYQMSYWKDIGMLCCFLAITLFLGLILRKPLIKVTAFFEERLEDSKLM